MEAITGIKIYGLEEKKSIYIQSKVDKYLKLLNISNKYIKVRFVNKIPGCNKNVLGMYEVEYVTRPHKETSNIHTIYINKNILGNRYKLLKTLMHELVHIKQYISGKMSWVKYNSKSEKVFVFWKQKKMGEFSDLEYYSSPWEIEARKIEDRMWKERKL